MGKDNKTITDHLIDQVKGLRKGWEDKLEHLDE
jgi:hypothetical protein